MAIDGSPTSRTGQARACQQLPYHHYLQLRTRAPEPMLAFECSSRYDMLEAQTAKEPLWTIECTCCTRRSHIEFYPYRVLIREVDGVLLLLYPLGLLFVLPIPDISLLSEAPYLPASTLKSRADECCEMDQKSPWPGLFFLESRSLVPSTLS